MNFRVDLDQDRFEKLSKLAERRGVVTAELACQVVRSYIDKRGPRREALQAYDYQLTERQRDVLWTLHDFQAMTFRQIDRAFSSSPESEGTYTSKCLVSLVELDLAERHHLDFQPYGYDRTIFTLTPQTVYVLEVARRGPRGVRVVRRPYPPQLLTPRQLSHHLMTVDVGVAFKSPKNRALGELVEWSMQSEYRFPYMGSLRRIIPDAHGLWDSGDEFIHSFIVEVVRSRQEAHLVRRIRNYNYWQQAKAFEKDEGTRTVPPILFITTSHLHQEVFRSIVFGTLAAHVGVAEAARNLVFGLAVLDDLVEMGPCAPVWSLPLQSEDGLEFGEVCVRLSKMVS